jgi:hypothetical protein
MKVVSRQRSRIAVLKTRHLRPPVKRRVTGMESDFERQDLPADHALPDAKPHVYYPHLRPPVAALDRYFIAFLKAIVRVDAQQKVGLTGRKGVRLEELGLHFYSYLRAWAIGIPAAWRDGM